ncbi:MAG TPA: 2-C-methyl-D-erythritol 2,4-cyclodiphosphate synthase, partial [Glaciecola sp.]|nr:2-C-methyl-D-erythritol 2,4-cyclodiphosphate synthase [Glaciecola sp.]
QEKGYSIGNADITIVAQAPKMAPHIDSMRTHIANVLTTSINNINVKATTTERLGYTGRKEGIATHAVVIVQRTTDISL